MPALILSSEAALSMLRVAVSHRPVCAPSCVAIFRLACSFVFLNILMSTQRRAPAANTRPDFCWEPATRSDGGGLAREFEDQWIVVRKMVPSGYHSQGGISIGINNFHRRSSRRCKVLDSPRTRLVTVICARVPDSHTVVLSYVGDPSMLEIDLVHSLSTCSYLLPLRLRAAGRFVLLRRACRRAGPACQIMERPAVAAAPLPSLRFM